MKEKKAARATVTVTMKPCCLCLHTQIKQIHSHTHIHHIYCISAMVLLETLWTLNLLGNLIFCSKMNSLGVTHKIQNYKNTQRALTSTKTAQCPRNLIPCFWSDCGLFLKMSSNSIHIFLSYVANQFSHKHDFLPCLFICLLSKPVFPCKVAWGIVYVSIIGL